MKTSNLSKGNLNITDILVNNFGVRFGENINICLVDVEDYIFPSFSKEKILFQRIQFCFTRLLYIKRNGKYFK